MTRPPCYLLVPAHLRFRPGTWLLTIRGYELHRAFPDSRPVTMVMPFPARTNGERAMVHAFSLTLTLYLRAWRREVTHTPRERRREARGGPRGRRAAVAVPVTERFACDIYAPEDTPQDVIQEAIVGRLGSIEARWSRRSGA